MFILILIGIVLAFFLLFMLWKLWRGIGDLRSALFWIKMDLSSSRWDESEKVKEANEESKKWLIYGFGGTLLVVFLLALYIIFARYIFIKNHEHVYDVEIITKESTCSEEGILQVKCRYCDEKYEKFIPTKDHSYVKIEEIKPTCKKEGEIIYKCEECGCEKTDDFGTIIDHIYEQIDCQDPTCVQRGVKTSRCTMCGIIKSDYFGAITNHEYEQIDCQDSTCVQEGVKTFQCKICGDTKTETIPLAVHQYKETERTEPTCTEEGTIVYRCDICQEVKTEAIPTAEHTYLETERAAQTCSESGWVIVRCQYCGNEKTETLPADGEHQYTVVSFQVEGHTATYVCDRCGTVRQESLSSEEMKLLWSKCEVYHEREITEVWEAEPNRKTDIAMPVANFQKVVANLANENDVDCFSFTVSRKSDMEFDFSHDGDFVAGGYYWYATVYDTDGVTIINEGNITNKDKGEIATFSVSELDPGTYYIKISRAVGGNPLIHNFTDTFYYITFRPKCVSHDVVSYLLKVPTCLEDGEYINVCSECDEHVSTEVIKAFDHEWSEWHTLKEAKILSKGERNRTCSICMAFEREGFLHSGSVIIMIAIAVVMIIIIVLLAVNEQWGWMVIAIIITVVFLIVFYIRLFAGSMANVSGSDVKSQDAMSSDEEAAEPAWILMSVTARGGLNVRKKPSTEGDIVLVLKNGEKVEVLSEASDEWVYVRCIERNDEEGYVSSKYLTPVEEQ